MTTDPDGDTPPASNLDLIARLELALIERLEIGFETVNVDTVHDIAQYLIDNEELGPDFDSSEGERVVTLGMFIYGFMHRFHDG